MLLKKNVLILHPADKSACAFYRCHAVAMLLNSTAGGDTWNGGSGPGSERLLS